MAFKMKGVKHFTKDKAEWNGPTHKMDDGSLHTGKTHNKNSEELFHKGDSALKKKKKGMDGKACWKGYKLAGTKKKGGKTVDNCVPVKRKKK